MSYSLKLYVHILKKFYYIILYLQFIYFEKNYKVFYLVKKAIPCLTLTNLFFHSIQGPCDIY